MMIIHEGSETNILVKTNFRRNSRHNMRKLQHSYRNTGRARAYREASKWNLHSNNILHTHLLHYKVQIHE